MALPNRFTKTYGFLFARGHLALTLRSCSHLSRASASSASTCSMRPFVFAAAGSNRRSSASLYLGTINNSAGWLSRLRSVFLRPRISPDLAPSLNANSSSAWFLTCRLAEKGLPGSPGRITLRNSRRCASSRPCLSPSICEALPRTLGATERARRRKRCRAMFADSRDCGIDIRPMTGSAVQTIKSTAVAYRTAAQAGLTITLSVRGCFGARHSSANATSSSIDRNVCDAVRATTSMR